MAGAAGSSTIAAGFGAADAGFLTAGFMDDALRGSRMVWSAGKTPATVRGLSSFIVWTGASSSASMGASINRRGLRILAANSDGPLDAAEITS
jgi:hypothetical protein